VEGNRAYGRGDRQAALAAYGRALQHEETRATANLNLGRLYLESQDAKAAKEHLDRGLAERPGFSAGHVQRARAEVALGQNDAAQLDLKKAIVIEPESGEAWLELAKLHGAQKNYAEALQALSKVRATGIQAEATFLSLEYHRQLGQGEASVAELEALITAQPYLARAYFELAALLLEKKDYREAERRLRRGLELEPANRGGRLALAESLERMGRWDLALPQLEAVLAGTSDGDPLAQKAQQILARQPKLNP
jgi:tetratricopeptide (TPR) repeat protein